MNADEGKSPLFAGAPRAPVTFDTHYTMPDRLSDPSLSPIGGVRIGVFDSGVGGLSVLRALRERMPEAELLYVADSGYAPYGEKTDAFVVERSLAIARFLLEQGADLLVVACNTATAAAVHALREAHPSLPIVGIEPGLKPAVALSARGRVGVMATTGTLRSARFRQLVERHGGQAQVHLQPCPGLAAAIETGDLDTPALRELVETFCAPLRAAEVDTVVLGCTHYPFVAPLIAQAMGPAVTLVDTSEAVARQTVRLATARLAGRTPSPHTSPLAGGMRLWSSGDPDRLSSTVHRWLGLEAQASRLP